MKRKDRVEVVRESPQLKSLFDKRKLRNETLKEDPIGFDSVKPDRVYIFLLCQEDTL